MKSSPSLEKVSSAELHNSGKTEAFVFLKKWIEAYGGKEPKNKLFSKLKFFFVSLSCFVLLLLGAVICFLWSAFAISILLFLISFLIDIPLWFYVATILIVGFSGGFSSGVDVAEDFIDSDGMGLVKYRKIKLEKIESDFIETFVNKFGFSYLNPSMGDLQKVQDFIVWQKRIAENFLPDDVENKDDLTKNTAISFFDTKLNFLKDEFINKENFVKATRTSAAATKQLIKGAMKNPEFKAIFSSLQSGDFKLGDLTQGNEHRLMEFLSK